MAQATNYFDNPATGFKQYRGSFVGGLVESGEFSFTTTGTTVEVRTYFSKLLMAIVTCQETVSTHETLFCDLVVTEGAVTVSRVANNISEEFHFPLPESQFASNDVSTTPLMVAQQAMTLVQTELYEGTAITRGTGSPTWDMEKQGTANHFLSGKTLGETDNTVTTWNLAAHANTAIAAGDVIQVNSNSGDGGGPADYVTSIQATSTGSYTSGLTFNYMFIGIY